MLTLLVMLRCNSREAGSGWPGAPMADLSTKVPPFFARLAGKINLRRKAPHICAPQAKKIFKQAVRLAGFVRKLGRCERTPAWPGRPACAAQVARASCSQTSIALGIACAAACLQRPPAGGKLCRRNARTELYGSGFRANEAPERSTVTR